MPMTESTYRGGDIYSVDCTGDVVTGDHVCFEKAIFSGSFRNAKFSHFERIEALIVSDSYGADKQQHTFSIVKADKTRTTIKGRVLYRNGVWRKPWPDEELRKLVADEKHGRGDRARADRMDRVNDPFSRFL